jgi:hypothetical protein
MTLLRCFQDQNGRVRYDAKFSAKGLSIEVIVNVTDRHSQEQEHEDTNRAQATAKCVRNGAINGCDIPQ